MGVRSTSTMVVTSGPPSALTDAWRRCQRAGTVPPWERLVALRCEPEGGAPFSASIPAEGTLLFWCGPPDPDPTAAEKVGAIAWALAREASGEGPAWVVGASDSTGASWSARVEGGARVWLDVCEEGVRERWIADTAAPSERGGTADSRASCNRGVAEVLGVETCDIELLLEAFEEVEVAPRPEQVTTAAPLRGAVPSPDHGLLPQSHMCGSCRGPIHSGDWSHESSIWDLARPQRALDAVVLLPAVIGLMAVLFVPMTTVQLAMAVVAVAVVTAVVRRGATVLVVRRLTRQVAAGPGATCRACGWRGRPAPR